jgi:2-polyprenyl-3-methyl-5-hydroxy-6-metoxy-1,4-benzoquinol methylase
MNRPETAADRGAYAGWECPLCGSARARSSWAGITLFAERRFEYLQCTACGSLACEPMPDADVLAQIYGPGYAELVTADHEVQDPKQPERVCDYLASRPTGRFIDFGCGSGTLLERARDLGWDAAGVEFDEAVARATAARTGLTVSTVGAALNGVPPADVLHLGDVIEHLTSPLDEVRAALSLVRPGGTLVAQGPLENNLTVFGLAKRAVGRLRPSRERQQPPTHVLQATASGQRTFFRRLGLDERTFDVFEVEWPAPASLAACGRDARLITLLVLRRISLAAGRVTPKTWGDRYFYVGSKSA